MAICWLRNEGADRGRASYFLIHGTWQALDALLWYDIDYAGNECSELNRTLSNQVMPLVVCALMMFQMLFSEILLFMANRRVYLTRWTAFKFVSGAFLCWFVMFDEVRSGRCTTIIDMPTMVSSRLLEWCDQEFSLKALAVYAYTAVVGYDDPAERSKLAALTTSPILFVALGVVLAQIVLFGSFHLSLLCFFCFGMFVPAVWGPRAIVRTACW